MVLGLLVAACGGSGFAPSFDALEITIAGVVQKGTLQAGARGQVRGLDASLRDLGRPSAVALVGVDGYSASMLTNASYVEVAFTAGYFDEFQNREITTPVTLRALVPTPVLLGSMRVNVNIATTLVAARVAVLVRAAAPSVDPVLQAERELHAALDFAGLVCRPHGFHRADVTTSLDADSWLMRATLTVLGAQQRLGLGLDTLLERMAADLADNGMLDDRALRDALAFADRSVDYEAGVSRLRARYASAGQAVNVAAASLCENKAPIAATLSPRTVLVGESVRLEAGASIDPEGGPLLFAWRAVREQSDKPYWPTPPFDEIHGSGTSFDLVTSRAASYAVTLSVTDRFGAVAMSSVRLVARHAFNDNVDGTVTNLQTGLIWQRNDDVNRYTLAEARGRPVLSAGDNNGLDVCGQLALAGHDDWRVPTLPEVQSLVDFSDPVNPTNAVVAIHRDFVVSNSWIPNSHVDFVHFGDGARIVHADARTPGLSALRAALKKRAGQITAARLRFEKRR